MFFFSLFYPVFCFLFFFLIWFPARKWPVTRTRNDYYLPLQKHHAKCSSFIWAGVEMKSGGKKEKVRVNLLLGIKESCACFYSTHHHLLHQFSWYKTKKKKEAPGKKIHQGRERERESKIRWWVSVVIVTFTPFLFTFFSFFFFIRYYFLLSVVSSPSRVKTRRQLQFFSGYTYLYSFLE